MNCCVLSVLCLTCCVIDLSLEVETPRKEVIGNSPLRTRLGVDCTRRDCE